MRLPSGSYRLPDAVLYGLFCQQRPLRKLRNADARSLLWEWEFQNQLAITAFLQPNGNPQAPQPIFGRPLRLTHEFPCKANPFDRKGPAQSSPTPFFLPMRHEVILDLQSFRIDRVIGAVDEIGREYRR